MKIWTVFLGDKKIRLVYKEMSSTLSKVSKKVRKDEDTSKGLDKLEEQLKNYE